MSTINDVYLLFSFECTDVLNQPVIAKEAVFEEIFSCNSHVLSLLITS